MITGSESADTINNRLIDLYGKVLSGEPKYRLVFSSMQYEKRRGEFSDYYGQIYLRTVIEVREVKKYPNNPDRWILERFIYNEGNPELISNFSYEPVWIFNGKKNTYVFPSWAAVDFVMQSHLLCLAGKSPEEHIKEAIEQEDKEKAEESQYIMDVVGEECRSPLFESESAVSFAGMDARSKK